MFEQVNNIIKQLNSKLITGVNVFDVYEGKPLEASQKAMSISIDLYDGSKTLSDQDIDPLMEKLIGRFETELQAIIRK